MAKHRLPRGARRQRVHRADGIWTVGPIPPSPWMRFVTAVAESAGVAVFSCAVTILATVLAVALGVT